MSAILLVLVWSGAFLATHLPKMPSVVPSSDKTLHFLGFMVLAGVLGLFLAVRRQFAFRWLAAMLAVLAVYAAFDELTQMLVPNRHADWRDWVADMNGAAIGTALVGGLWWAWSNRGK
ncbi:MAG: VanZ family protein [Pirellulales bacterium]